MQFIFATTNMVGLGFKFLSKLNVFLLPQNDLNQLIQQLLENDIQFFNV